MNPPRCVPDQPTTDSMPAQAVVVIIMVIIVVGLIALWYQDRA